MPEKQVFDYLPLLRRSDGAARYPRPRFQDSQQTQDNRTNRSGHSAHLGGQAAAVTGNWQSQQTTRVQEGLPSIGDGIPLLLQIDETLDIDDLRSFFRFEIISEVPNPNRFSHVDNLLRMQIASGFVEKQLVECGEV